MSLNKNFVYSPDSISQKNTFNFKIKLRLHDTAFWQLFPDSYTLILICGPNSTILNLPTPQDG